MTEEIQWEPITRAWLMIKVGDVNKVALAEDIFALIERFQNFPKIHIVRADIVSGPYVLVVPVDTELFSELEDLKEIIKAVLPDGSEMDTALVAQHVPFHPWETKGFVTYQELLEEPLTSQLASLSSKDPAAGQGDESEPVEISEGHKAWMAEATADELAAADSEEQPSRGSRGHRAW